MSVLKKSCLPSIAPNPPIRQVANEPERPVWVWPNAVASDIKMAMDERRRPSRDLVRSFWYKESYVVDHQVHNSARYFVQSLVQYSSSCLLQYLIRYLIFRALLGTVRGAVLVLFIHTLAQASLLGRSGRV